MDIIDSSEFLDDSPSAGNTLTNGYSFKQIGSITKFVEPISGENPIDMLVELFQNDPDLTAVPIEEMDHVIGVIDRKTVMAATNSTWKRLTSGNISSYVTRINTVLYANEFIEKTLQKISAINRETGVMYFSVFNSRTFMGIVSLEDFLQRIADIREQDLEKAAQIQKNLLPSRDTIDAFPFQIMAYNQMANTLGGDFYQVERNDEKHYIFACYDVSGKNVAASLITVALGAFLKPLKMLKNRPGHPLEIVAMLDKYLEQIVPMGTFVTAALCFCDMERKQMYIFNCGHTTVYSLFKDDGNNVKLAAIKPGLPPLGMGGVAKALQESVNAEKKPYAALPIKENMHLELYSDGFTDMQNDDGTRFDDSRAKDFFINLYNTSVQESYKLTDSTIKNWIQKSMLPDDITVLDIRF